jgi:hypothetical protein
MTTGQFLWGLSNGIAILGISGAFWCGLGLGPPAFAVGITPWIAVLVLMISGAAAALGAARALRRRSGFRRSDLQRSDPETRRIMVGMAIVAVVETALVGAAVLICVYVDRQDLLWPAIGVAISLHFVPLARLFNVSAYYITAAAGLAVSVVALRAPLGSIRLVWLGAGMSVVMWSSAVYLVRRAHVIAGRPPDVLTT